MENTSTPWPNLYVLGCWKRRSDILSTLVRRFPQYRVRSFATFYCEFLQHVFGLELNLEDGLNFPRERQVDMIQALSPVLHLDQLSLYATRGVQFFSLHYQWYFQEWIPRSDKVVESLWPAWWRQLFEQLLRPVLVQVLPLSHLATFQNHGKRLTEARSECSLSNWIRILQSSFAQHFHPRFVHDLLAHPRFAHVKDQDSSEKRVPRAASILSLTKEEYSVVGFTSLTCTCSPQSNQLDLKFSCSRCLQGSLTRIQRPESPSQSLSSSNNSSLPTFQQDILTFANDTDQQDWNRILSLFWPQEVQVTLVKPLCIVVQNGSEHGIPLDVEGETKEINPKSTWNEPNLQTLVLTTDLTRDSIDRILKVLHHFIRPNMWCPAAIQLTLQLFRHGQTLFLDPFSVIPPHSALPLLVTFCPSGRIISCADLPSRQDEIIPWERKHRIFPPLDITQSFLPSVQWICLESKAYEFRQRMNHIFFWTDPFQELLEARLEQHHSNRHETQEGGGENVLGSNVVQWSLEQDLKPRSNVLVQASQLQWNRTLQDSDWIHASNQVIQVIIGLRLDELDSTKVQSNKNQIRWGTSV